MLREMYVFRERVSSERKGESILRDTKKQI